MKKWFSDRLSHLSWGRVGKVCCYVLSAWILVVGAVYLWGIVFYHGPFHQGGWGNGLLGLLWLVGMVVVFFWIKIWKLRAVWWLAGLLMVLVPYLMIQPSHDKEWEPEFARLGYVQIKGDEITLYNVRNFAHRTRGDFDERWESRRYHLSNLRGLDYFQSNFYGDTLAHPLLSFDFGDEGRICLSVETRREKGESFTPFGGLYKVFELQYLFVTEDDCIPLRTKVRGEVVRRYTIDGPIEKIRAMFLASVAIQNALAQEPQYYNVLHANCTTSLRAQQPKSDRVPWDTRLLLNGRLDEYLYERGLILSDGLSFDELRERAIVNDVANRQAGKSGFSTKIRTGN